MKPFPGTTTTLNLSFFLVLSSKKERSERPIVMFQRAILVQTPSHKLQSSNHNIDHRYHCTPALVTIIPHICHFLHSRNLRPRSFTHESV